MNMQDERRATHTRTLLRGRILDAAMELFSARGIKATRMEDVARSLSISKRTLYEVYDDKEALLRECILRYMHERKADVVAYASGCDNVMEILLYALGKKLEEARRTNPAVYDDIRRYPQITKLLEADKAEDQLQLGAFLERGAAEGFFREGINHELAYIVIDTMSRHIMHARLYERFPMEDIFLNVAMTQIRGICTIKGIEEIDKFIAKLRF